MRRPSRPRTLASVDRFFQFSLLGLVASGFLALVSSHYPDRFTVILTLAALIVRGFALAGLVRIDIPPRVIAFVAIGYVLFYPLDFFYLSKDFLASTVHGVCFLAGVKILTANSNRDYIYTGAVAFIELIGAALLSFQAGFFLYLALYIAFTIAAFTSAEIRRGIERSPQTAYLAGTRIGWRLTVVALSATLGILAITAGLFLIVPRTARAAALLFPNAPHLTGFSNIVDLGTFGEISKDTRPVMHVQSYLHALPPNVKWRGAALSRFDGFRWSEPALPVFEVNARSGTAEVAGVLQRSRRDGRRLLYRVDVNSSDTGTLFIAGIPEYINLTTQRLVRTRDDSFRILPVTGGELHYEVSAHSGPLLAEPLEDRDRPRYLHLPQIDPRIGAEARAWAGDAPPIDQALRIQTHLRQDFRYTLSNPKTPVSDPLANFLFVSKAGYCEYFASAMAVMLRTLGIPSRVATGFQTGYFNDVSGLYVLRASDAHAWVEAWIEGRGWVTFDPTPDAAPHLSSLGERLGMYLDAADSTWRQWVIAYDLGHQVFLAARIARSLNRYSLARAMRARHWGIDTLNEAKRRGEQAVAWTLSAALAIALLAFAGPHAFRAWRNRAELRRIARDGGNAGDAAILYRRMLASLEKRGFEKPAWFTPQEFVRQLPAFEGELAGRFTVVYNEVRFGGRTSRNAELIEILTRMEAADRKR